MKRVGFMLKVRPDKVQEYREQHKAVWPEMQAALRRNGWHRYSIFMNDDGLLFGYFETPDCFAAALEGMSREEVNRRWQEMVAPYFEVLKVAGSKTASRSGTPRSSGGAAVAYADESMLQLEEVFHLD